MAKTRSSVTPLTRRSQQSEQIVTADSPSSASSGLHVYDFIKTRILTLEYRPGENLSDIDFVTKLKVSRTPVREALIKLASEGLVKLHANRGAWVSEITLADIRQFFEALDVAQRMVTRLAAERMGSDAHPALAEYARRFDQAAARGNVCAMDEANFHFHSIIAENCGNALVADHYIRLLNFGRRISHLALTYERSTKETESEKLADIGEEHQKMLKYIMAGNMDLAEDVAREHTLHFRQRVLNYMLSKSTAGISVRGSR